MLPQSRPRGTIFESLRQQGMGIQKLSWIHGLLARQLAPVICFFVGYSPPPAHQNVVRGRRFVQIVIVPIIDVLLGGL